MASLKQIIFAAALGLCLATALARGSKQTKLQFYMHDVVLGTNTTAVRVAPTQLINFGGSNLVQSMFGSLYVVDDPLTVSPDPKSEPVGRAQGLYTMASRSDELCLVMSLVYSFTGGPYNGSSFSVLTRNPVMQKGREMPVVGGTGMFRLATGYCLATTVSSNGPNAVIQYNVTLFHY